MKPIELLHFIKNSIGRDNDNEAALLRPLELIQEAAEEAIAELDKQIEQLKAENLKLANEVSTVTFCRRKESKRFNEYIKTLEKELEKAQKHLQASLCDLIPAAKDVMAELEKAQKHLKEEGMRHYDTKAELKKVEAERDKYKQALQELFDAENLPYNECCSDCDDDYFSILHKAVEQAKEALKQGD